MGKTVQPQAQRLVRFALAVLPGHQSIAYTRTPSDPLLLEPLARMSSDGSIRCVTQADIEDPEIRRLLPYGSLEMENVELAGRQGEDATDPAKSKKDKT